MWFNMYITCLILFAGSEALPTFHGGEIRLLSSSNANEGLLQVLNGKFWNVVCYQQWTRENSRVACRSLGYLDVRRDARMTTGGSDKQLYHSFAVLDITCRGKETDLGSCRNRESPNQTCDPQHVVWLSCLPNPKPKIIPDSSLPMQPEFIMETVEVMRITSNSISMDWTDWYQQSRSHFEEDFVVRFNILYRKADDEDDQFRIGMEVPNYFTYGSVQRLEESTMYEFKIEVVRLGFITEEIGLISPTFTAATTCSGPSPVQSVNASSEQLPGAELTISWQPGIDPKCPPEEFIVDYVTLSIEQCKFEFENMDLTPVGTTTENLTKINNLHPYSTYSISVTASNRYGRSTTKSYVEIQTEEEVPSGPPTEIKAKFVSGKDTLKVTWRPPLCGSRNGVITGYTYMLLDVQTDRVISTDDTEAKMINLPNINPLRKYKVLVAAKTKVGMGPYGAASVAGRIDIKDICGEGSQSVNVRVASGKDSGAGSAPWMAQIWHIRNGKNFCAGSILDKYWILTAAHCLLSRNITKYDIRIQVGDYDTLLPEPQQRVYDVDMVQIHTGFDTELFDNDIALIRVTEPIEFTQYIRPICLPTKKLARTLLQTPRAIGKVTGWGLDSYSRNPRYLQAVELPVVDRRICKKSTNYSFTQNMFCAGYAEEKRGDACLGDSGAPFSIRRNRKYYIVGIVSWGGQGCDTRDNYGFYTRVFKYLAWMKHVHGSLVTTDGT